MVATGCSSSGRRAESNRARIECRRSGEGGSRATHCEAVRHGRRGGGVQPRRTFIGRWRRPSRGVAWPGRSSDRTASSRTRSPSSCRRSGRKRVLQRGGQGRISHVDVRDIAAVASDSAQDTRPRGKDLHAQRPEALTYDDMAMNCRKRWARDIRHISLPPADLKAGMLAEAMPKRLPSDARPGARLP